MARPNDIRFCSTCGEAYPASGKGTISGKRLCPACRFETQRKVTDANWATAWDAVKPYDAVAELGSFVDVLPEGWKE